LYQGVHLDRSVHRTPPRDRAAAHRWAGDRAMPKIEVDGLQINYDVQGKGEPLLLIPYLSADHACYTFQLPAYTEHFRCIALDLPGTGESSKPPVRCPEFLGLVIH
jgi:pimeloyl-ACP methyl ester carboxylesterase